MRAHTWTHVLRVCGSMCVLAPRISASSTASSVPAEPYADKEKTSRQSMHMCSIHLGPWGTMQATLNHLNGFAGHQQHMHVCKSILPIDKPG